jgi:hypothetical protein
MTERARIFRTCEIFLPRNVVAEQGWTADTELWLVASPEGILIRPKSKSHQASNWDEIDRRRIPSPGPPIAEAQMEANLQWEAARRLLNKKRRSRWSSSTPISFSA